MSMQILLHLSYFIVHSLQKNDDLFLALAPALVRLYRLLQSVNNRAIGVVRAFKQLLDEVIARPKEYKQLIHHRRFGMIYHPEVGIWIQLHSILVHGRRKC